jgi:predicted enzyme related to lactoylglutathione lyase
LCWLELATPDLARATGWLAAVLGWDARRIAPRAHPHAWLSRGGYTFAGVSGRDPAEAPPGWTGYVQVADVDAALDRALALGAVAAGHPATIPGLVRHVRIADPVGTPLGLFQVLGADGPHRPLAPGERDPIALRCLTSPDPGRVAAFLRDLFSWAQDARGAAHLLTADKVAPVLIQLATAGPVPGWRFCFDVADLNTALAALGAAGGMVDDGAAPIPGWVGEALGCAAAPILTRDTDGIPFGLMQMRAGS